MASQVYHTCVRTLDELGQAAGRLLALHRFLVECTKRADSNSYKVRQGRLHIRKIQKIQWTERAGKRERNRVEFWLDVVVLEPHLLEGVPLPWMLTMDDLETWLSLQPAQPEFLGQVRSASKSPNSAATYGHISNWTTSAITDMKNLFCGATSGYFTYPNGPYCVNYGICCIPALASFNEPLNWDTSNVTRMDRMFRGAVDPTSNYPFSARGVPIGVSGSRNCAFCPHVGAKSKPRYQRVRSPSCRRSSGGSRRCAPRARTAGSC